MMTVIPAFAQLASNAGAPAFPDVRDRPLADWTGHVFQLSQDYPKAVPAPEDYPWLRFDPKTQPNEYARAVLNYSVEGNEAVDWDVHKNTVRKWYHTPWLHWGRNGREFIRGMTHERPSLPGELAATQVSQAQNWAVGIYNAPGAYTVGSVWRNPDAPDARLAVFPEGTVSMKLLFTQANPNEVPYLGGALQWDAYIYDSISVPPNPFASRSVNRLRLLQIDIAVKDNRVSDTGGWVFGTFVYNGNIPAARVWDRMAAVGLMWGNDPGVTVAAVRGGKRLAETWINPSSDVPFQHLGWAGRLNGPVDSPASSCLSCHATAQWPQGPGMLPPRSAAPDSPEYMQWFRNIKSPAEAFAPGGVSLDYSLQLMIGIANFAEWKRLAGDRGGVFVGKP